MKYITETELLSARQTNFSEKRQFLKEAAAQARVSIFLSHSHKDRAMVEGLISRLAALGITIYVDWNDSTMPRVTSRGTAAQLKLRMKQCDLFVVLATQNAIESKWVPWETGVGDQLKGEDRVFVIPVADPYGRFIGAEYLALYRKIAFDSSNEWSYFDPDTNLDLGYLKTYFANFR